MATRLAETPKMSPQQSTAFLTDAEVAAAARKLLDWLDVMPTDDALRSVCHLLRETYDRGRVRGAFEVEVE